MIHKWAICASYSYLRDRELVEGKQRVRSHSREEEGDRRSLEIPSPHFAMDIELHLTFSSCLMYILCSVCLIKSQAKQARTKGDDRRLTIQWSETTGLFAAVCRAQRVIVYLMPRCPILPPIYFASPSSVLRGRVERVMPSSITHRRPLVNLYLMGHPCSVEQLPAAQTEVRMPIWEVIGETRHTYFPRIIRQDILRRSGGMVPYSIVIGWPWYRTACDAGLKAWIIGCMGSFSFSTIPQRVYVSTLVSHYAVYSDLRPTQFATPEGMVMC
jgi:hypothetical protein